jgi:glycosyltransferase involved in cell wall biosynthesis
MRIVQVTPYFAPAFAYGGPPRSVLGLSRALLAAGADVRVVTTSADGDGELPDEITRAGSFDGVPVAYLPRSFPARDFRSAALGGALDAVARGCDLVHVHGCWNFFGWDAARWCRRAGVPYVLSPRGMLYPWSFRQGRWFRKWMSYRVFERPVLRRARFIHATSTQEASVVAALGLANEIVVVPNGLDDLDRTLPPRSETFRARYGARPGDFLTLFLGRVHQKKGLDILIAAFRQTMTAERRSVLLIAGTGDPDYVGRLQNETRDLVDAGRVAFAGQLSGDDRDLAFASADAFALTSHSENFGLAVAEAMAAGLPVVVSRDCPWPEIEAWRAGRWVDNTADRVADALRMLMDDPAGARAMGLNGQREVHIHLNWPRLAAEMLRLYAAATVQ